MAYSSINAPGQTGSIFFTFLSLLAKGVTGFFTSLSRAMMINATAQQRLDRVARLNQLSDAELAARGLKREDIVHHVFRDLFWN